MWGYCTEILRTDCYVRMHVHTCIRLSYEPEYSMLELMRTHTCIETLFNIYCILFIDISYISARIEFKQLRTTFAFKGILTMYHHESFLCNYQWARMTVQYISYLQFFNSSNEFCRGLNQSLNFFLRKQSTARVSRFSDLPKHIFFLVFSNRNLKGYLSLLAKNIVLVSKVTALLWATSLRPH